MATDLRGVDDKCFKLSGLAIFGDDNRLTTFKLRSLVFPSSFDEAALRAIPLPRGHRRGRLPAPRERSPMFQAHGVWGAFYDLIEGDCIDAHQAEVRRTLAAALAALAGVTSRLDATGLPLSPARGATRLGTPHQLGMDLVLAGGEWIDALADAARIGYGLLLATACHAARALRGRSSIMRRGCRAGP